MLIVWPWGEGRRTLYVHAAGCWRRYTLASLSRIAVFLCPCGDIGAFWFGAGRQLVVFARRRAAVPQQARSFHDLALSNIQFAASWRAAHIYSHTGKTGGRVSKGNTLVWSREQITHRYRQLSVLPLCQANAASSRRNCTSFLATLTVCMCGLVIGCHPTEARL